MCGICGVAFNSSQKADSHLLQRMCRTIVHRGPDDEGIFVDGRAGIGMRRLSIIDLQTGQQPQFNETGDFAIVFNGEIYNFQELRRTLQQKGHTFCTNSDTETILHAYEEYGEKCLQYLNGMFGFAIYDKQSGSFFLARDRIGIKPLYYYFDEKIFAFGSEIKPILEVEGTDRTVDTEALNLFLTFEYIPAPRSIFKFIRKVPPGHYLIYRPHQIEVKKYWDVELDGPKYRNEEEYAEELRGLLQDSVRLRLISDVPLGAFLSGGIDSSTVVALMAQVMDRPVKTFSIGFEDQSYNELNYARLIAKRFQTEHTEFIIRPDAIELVEKLVYHLDEPLGDFSIFPTYLVSKMARDHVTVILSGDGGDELFGGYETYIADRLVRKYGIAGQVFRRKTVQKLVLALPPQKQKKGLINKLRRFAEGMQYPEDLQHVRWMIFLSDPDRMRLFSDDLKAELNGTVPYQFIREYFNRAHARLDLLNQQNFVDLKTYLVDDILVKVDRMSMATSLEARVPFLDHRVVQKAFEIPGDWKIRGKDTKYILKKAMRDLLPREILYRDKQGFSIPIKNWIREELREMMLDVLNERKLAQQGYFNPAYVNRLIEEHLSGKENHSHRLWALMMFELWCEKFLSNGKVPT
jgi:asparagine synthase (glutamine-hydrolysing)